MGLDAVTVLPATTFGPYDFNYSVARMIENIDAGLIFIYPPGGITVAHADAVAEGHLRAAQLGRTGARYVLGGEHLTFRDLFARIARRLGRRPPWLPVPPRALRILGAGGSLASTLARRDLGLTSTSARLSCLHLYYDSAKAIHELGYEPRSADDALTQACCWYRDGANARAA
jgi:dihydroflavonol-4-reductase